MPRNDILFDLVWPVMYRGVRKGNAFDQHSSRRCVVKTCFSNSSSSWSGLSRFRANRSHGGPSSDFFQWSHPRWRKKVMNGLGSHWLEKRRGIKYIFSDISASSHARARD